MMSATDIVVAGAGALGATIATALARPGRRISVFDPSPPQATASAIAAGMLAPAFEALFDETSEGRFPLLETARDLWPAQAAALGLDLDRSGAIAVGRPAETVGWAERLAAMGARAELRDPASIAALGVSPGLAGVFTPDDWRLDATEALTALRRQGASAGVRYAAGAVGEFRQGSLVRADADADADRARADLLIIATGASRSLAHLAPELVGLRPIKGHILRAPRQDGPGPTLRGGGVYLCPTPQALILGASMETGRDDVAVDPTVVEGLVARAANLSPALAERAWTAQVGVRAETPDGLPLVGWSSSPGVMLAVGARRNGWLLAPLIARIVAALADGRPPPAEAKLFDPARLSVSRPR